MSESETIGIKIGMDKRAVQEVATSILATLEADCDETTKVSALGTLGALSSVSNCTFQDMNIQMGNAVDGAALVSEVGIDEDLED